MYGSATFAIVWSSACMSVAPTVHSVMISRCGTRSCETTAIDYPRPEVTPEDRRPRRRTTLGDTGLFDRELMRRGLVRRIGVVVPDSYTALAGAWRGAA